MDRCPNCGSTIRIGAKFCTSCGFRLRESEPDAAPAVPSRSPFATTTASSEEARSSWNAASWAPAAEPAAQSDPVSESAPPSDAAPSVPRANLDADDGHGGHLEPAAVAAAEPAPEPGWHGDPAPDGEPSTWPAFPTADRGSAGAAGEAVDVAILEVPTAAHADTEADDLWPTSDDILSAFERSGQAPSNPSPFVASAELEPSDEPMPHDSSASVVDATFHGHDDARPLEPPIAAHADTGTEADDLWPTFDDSVDVEPLPVAEVPSDPAPSTAGPVESAPVPYAAEPAVSEPQSASIGAASIAVGSDAQTRANALLDELRTLLGGMSVATPAAEASEAAVADDLAEVRSDSPGDAPEVDDLRDVIASAQARPRDVDVMLALVGNADALASLLLAHDRYREAIDSAVERLRSKA